MCKNNRNKLKSSNRKFWNCAKNWKCIAFRYGVEIMNWELLFIYFFLRIFLFASQNINWNYFQLNRLSKDVIRNGPHRFFHISVFSFITIFLSTKHSNWILWVFLCSRTGLQQDWKNGGKRKDLCLSQSERQFWLRVWIKLESNAVLMAFRRQDSLNEGKSIHRHTLTYQRGGVCVTVFAMMK